MKGKELLQCILALVGIIPVQLLSINKEETCSQDATCASDVATVFSQMSKGQVNFKPNWKTPDYIKSHGFKVETHTIKTEDGYLLTVYRIPHGKTGRYNKDSKAVYLMHGTLASSVIWMFQEPGRSLPFMLAEAGYDVWIGNARGTTYSSKHETLKEDDPAFWNFCVDEMGQYDIPAAVNYISEMKGSAKIYYIGHSLGETQFAVAMNFHPELNEKIAMNFALAPAFYIGKATNEFISILGRKSYHALASWNQIGKGKFGTELVTTLAQGFSQLGLKCVPSSVQCGLCKSGVWFYIWGYDPCQLHYNFIPDVMTHLPDTSSAKTVISGLQSHVKGSLNRFDYGPEENVIKYGNVNPPSYFLNKITAPVVIYGAPGDDIVSSQDFQKAASELPNLKGLVIPPWSRRFGHLDFAMGADAHEWIYSDIIARMNQQPNNPTT